MKRYLLFAFDWHDRQGGWSDFVASFDSVEDAQAWAKNMVYVLRDKYRAPIGETIQVVDSSTGQLLAEGHIPSAPAHYSYSPQGGYVRVQWKAVA